MRRNCADNRFAPAKDAIAVGPARHPRHARPCRVPRVPPVRGLVREVPPAGRLPAGTRRDKTPGEHCTGPAVRRSPARPGQCPSSARGVTYEPTDHDHHRNRPDRRAGHAHTGAGAHRLPRRLVDLRRLDALGLHRRQRHHGPLGREIRHFGRDRADQRLCGIDQPVHRRRLRRGLGDQHGHAVHPLRRRRRHHGAHHRRLFRRQRRDHRQGRDRPGRPRRQAGEPRGAVGLALPPGPRARQRGPRRTRPRRA